MLRFPSREKFAEYQLDFQKWVPKEANKCFKPSFQVFASFPSAWRTHRRSWVKPSKFV
jgi:hypothetical protein